MCHILPPPSFMLLPSHWLPPQLKPMSVPFIPLQTQRHTAGRFSQLPRYTVPSPFSTRCRTQALVGEREREGKSKHKEKLPESTMIQSMNPYSYPSKTAEIMSRYRPIAPKPAVPRNTMLESSFRSQNFRSLWPQLQDRPTRTRKRGRATISPATLNLKRARTHLLGLYSPAPVTSAAKNLSLQGFAPGLPRLPLPAPSLAPLSDGSSLEKAATSTTNLATHPLAPCATCAPITANQDVTELNFMKSSGAERGIDLNTVAEIPEEKDLLQQLQAPHSSNVIAPQPVRPIGSSISVGRISEDLGSNPLAKVPKKPEEVEEEVESDALPAVISDSNNKVRLANSAYKEMVGQPECPWLDSMGACDGRLGGSACKRISGEVILHLTDSKVPLSSYSNGFSCWVRIEWGSNGKKNSINTFCNVTRLTCGSKDYLFAWRFHTHYKEAGRSIPEA